MQRKLSIVALIVLMQACVPMLAQSPKDAMPQVSPGMLERAAETYSAAKAKAQSIGGTVLGFTSAYYADHIKPVTEPYIDWASSWVSAATSSFYDVMDKIPRYQPK